LRLWRGAMVSEQGLAKCSERKSSACEKDCSTVKNKRALAAERAPSEPQAFRPHSA
jgi:hypothetical protein